MKIMFPACRQSLELPPILPPKIQNWPTVTVIVIEHPQSVTCACGVTFAPIVRAVDRMHLGVAEVEQQAPSGIVIPGRC